MKMKKHASSKAILTDPEEYCPGTWNLEPAGTWDRNSNVRVPPKLGVGRQQRGALSTQQHFALSAQHSALSNILASKSAHKRRNLARENGTSVKISLTRTLLLIS